MLSKNINKNTLQEIRKKSRREINENHYSFRRKHQKTRLLTVRLTTVSLDILTQNQTKLREEIQRLSSTTPDSETIRAEIDARGGWSYAKLWDGETLKKQPLQPLLIQLQTSNQQRLSGKVSFKEPAARCCSESEWSGYVAIRAKFQIWNSSPSETLETIVKFQTWTDHVSILCPACSVHTFLSNRQSTPGIKFLTDVKIFQGAD